jgi:hypothetical protein
MLQTVDPSVDVTIVVVILLAVYVAAIIIGAVARLLLAVFIPIAEWFTRTFGR